MLYEVLRYLRNYFIASRHEGEFKVTDGALAEIKDGEETGLSYLAEGQYFLLEGSIFNDGVYQHTANGLTDEKAFNGAVVALKIPSEVLKLAEEIKAYNAEYGTPTPYQSESFGGYSYTKADSENAGGLTWQEAYKDRLKGWKKA